MSVFWVHREEDFISTSVTFFYLSYECVRAVCHTLLRTYITFVRNIWAIIFTQLHHMSEWHQVDEWWGRQRTYMCNWLSWSLRLLWKWLWRLLSSGIWRHVICCQSWESLIWRDSKCLWINRILMRPAALRDDSVGTSLLLTVLTS